MYKLCQSLGSSLQPFTGGISFAQRSRMGRISSSLAGGRRTVMRERDAVLARPMPAVVGMAITVFDLKSIGLSFEMRQKRLFEA